MVAAAQTQQQFEERYERQIITNTEKIIDQQRQINDLAEWRNQHMRDSYTDNAVLVGRLRELEVTVGAHDRALWVLVTAVIGLFIKMLADVVSKRKKPSDNGSSGGFQYRPMPMIPVRDDDRDDRR
jgi:Iap family predicted aminopeptidase